MNNRENFIFLNNLARTPQGALLVHSFGTPGAILVQSWCTPGAILVHSWCTPGAILVHSWCNPCALLVHSWCQSVSWKTDRNLSRWVLFLGEILVDYGFSRQNLTENFGFWSKIDQNYSKRLSRSGCSQIRLWLSSVWCRRFLWRVQFLLMKFGVFRLDSVHIRWSRGDLGSVTVCFCSLWRGPFQLRSCRNQAEAAETAAAASASASAAVSAAATATASATVTASAKANSESEASASTSASGRNVYFCFMISFPKYEIRSCLKHMTVIYQLNNDIQYISARIPGTNDHDSWVQTTIHGQTKI